MILYLDIMCASGYGWIVFKLYISRTDMNEARIKGIQQE